MGRLKAILGVLAVVVGSFAVFPVSAMADTIVCTDSGCNNTNIGEVSQQVSNNGISTSTITVNS